MWFLRSPSFAAAVVSAAVLAGPPALAAQGTPWRTVVPAGSVAQQTWTRAGSPYLVTGDVHVTGLTIEPGVTVLAAGEIRVVADLVARGRPAEPIRFAPSGATWTGLTFDRTPDGSVLEHCVVEGARTGLNITNSHPGIGGCLIRRNGVGILLNLDGVAYEVRDCILTQNAPFGGVDALLTGGAVLTLSNCQVTRNQRLSIFTPAGQHVAEGGGMRVRASDDSMLFLRDCSIVGNRAYSVDNTPLDLGDTYSRGGGVFFRCLQGCAADALTVENCVVLGNQVGAASLGSDAFAFAEGGGLFVGSSSFLMRNSVVAGNDLRAESCCYVEEFGGGILASVAACLVENSTIANNKRAGFHLRGHSSLPRLLTSNIVHGNETSITTSSPSISLAVTYSLVEGGFPGTGNFDADPVFAGPGPDPLDYFVLPASPCVDAGDPSPAADDGCPEVAFGTSRNDVGARGGPGNCGWGRSALPYCTGKANSLGCVPFLIGEGTPSVSSTAPFRLRAWDLLPAEGAFFLTSAGRAKLPFHGGRLCVASPLRRVHPTRFATSNGPVPCTGTLVRDYNQHVQSGHDPLLTVGARVHVQLLQRDPGDPAGFQDGLSNALQFFVQP